jgi:hypothetical protein
LKEDFMIIKQFISSAVCVALIGGCSTPPPAHEPKPITVAIIEPPLPPPGNEQVPVAIDKPAAIRQQSEFVNIGSEKGYRFIGAEIEIPILTCAEKDYIANYKAAYLLTWNSGLQPLVKKYTLELRRNPRSVDAKSNLSLFTNKRMRASKDKVIPLKKECAEENRLAKSNGEKASVTDLRALAAKVLPLTKK